MHGFISGPSIVFIPVTYCFDYYSFVILIDIFKRSACTGWKMDVGREGRNGPESEAGSRHRWDR